MVIPFSCMYSVWILAQSGFHLIPNPLTSGIPKGSTTYNGTTNTLIKKYCTQHDWPPLFLLRLGPASPSFLHSWTLRVLFCLASLLRPLCGAPGLKELQAPGQKNALRQPPFQGYRRHAAPSPEAHKPKATDPAPYSNN